MKYVKYRFTVVGGDKRMLALLRLLLLRGHSVSAALVTDGISSLSGLTVYSSYEKAMEACDILVLPMPVTRDNTNIFSLGTDTAVSIENILDCARRCNIKYVLAGNVSDKINELAYKRGIEIIDYSLNEDFLQKNAQATAEGALMIGMENIDRTINKSNILVSGYGRIAKYLSHMLYSLGAHVTVAARSDEALRLARLAGYDTVSLSQENSEQEIKNALCNSDIVFNTVPCHIFDSQTLSRDSKALYIELASCPGGIDLKAARDVGIRVIFAPSLPGRCFPESAGGYIYDGIYECLKERRVYI